MRLVRTVFLIASVAGGLSLGGCEDEVEVPDPPNISPRMPANPTPSDDALEVPISQVFEWTADVSDGSDLQFDVYLGASADPPLVAEDLSVPSYAPTQLLLDRGYYWRVVAIHNNGNRTAGPIWHFATDPGEWNSIGGAPNLSLGQALRGIWGSSSSDVFAVGDEQTIVHWDGIGWDQMSVPGSTSTTFQGVWGASSSAVFVTGNFPTAVLELNGSNWDPVFSPGCCLSGIWASASDNVVAVAYSGTNKVYRYDGSAWKNQLSCGALPWWVNTVFGVAPNDILMAGSSGAAGRFNGLVCQSLGATRTSKSLFGIWATSSDDIFCVGADGVITHFDGEEWTLMDSSTSEDLNGVWGSSRDNVFAVGDGGVILHFDGRGWRLQTGKPGQPQNDIFAIWGSSGNDVFCAGEAGMVLRLGPTE